MAITPAVALDYAEDLAEPMTSGTFNVAAGDLIVVLFHCDESGDTTGGINTVAVSDNNTPDLTWNPILLRGAELIGTNAAFVGAWWAYSADAITGLTVTVDPAGDIGSGDCAIKIILVSGNVSSTDPIGATASGNWSTDPQTTASITPETSGVGICAASDWNAASHITTSSDLTLTSFAISSGNMDLCSGYKTLSAGVGATANLNAAAGVDGNYIWFEIRDEGGGAGRTTKNTRAFPLGVEIGMNFGGQI